MGALCYAGAELGVGLYVPQDGVAWLHGHCVVFLSRQRQNALFLIPLQ